MTRLNPYAPEILGWLTLQSDKNLVNEFARELKLGRFTSIPYRVRVRMRRQDLIKFNRRGVRKSYELTPRGVQILREVTANI